MLSGIADGGVRWRRRQRRTENGQQQQVRTPGAHPAHVSVVEAQQGSHVTGPGRLWNGTGSQNVKSRQRPEVCPCSVGELGGFHAMLTTRGPKLLHGGEPRSVANVDATPYATATAHPRASRGRAIASKFLQNHIQPMALKAQHTISKLPKKLIRGRDLLPELWGHDCGGDWSDH